MWEGKVPLITWYQQVLKFQPGNNNFIYMYFTIMHTKGLKKLCKAWVIFYLVYYIVTLHSEIHACI